MKKILILAVALLLVASTSYAASVNLATIDGSKHKVSQGFGRFCVYADSCKASTLVTGPAVELKNPQWTFLPGSTNYCVLPISITPYSTTGSDTIHVGIETSEDGTNWYSFYNYALQASVTAQGTVRTHFLLLPQRFVRLKLYALTTASYGEYVYVSYPSKGVN